MFNLYDVHYNAGTCGKHLIKKNPNHIKLGISIPEEIPEGNAPWIRLVYSDGETDTDGNLIEKLIDIEIS